MGIDLLCSELNGYRLLSRHYIFGIQWLLNLFRSYSGLLIFIFLTRDTFLNKPMTDPNDEIEEKCTSLYTCEIRCFITVVLRDRSTVTCLPACLSLKVVFCMHRVLLSYQCASTAKSYDDY